MLETIIKIISEQLGVDVEQITAETNIEELGADSLDVVEMLVRFEDETGIVFADDDVMAMRTVEDVLAYAQTQEEL